MITSNFSDQELKVLRAGYGTMDRVFSATETSLDSFKIIIDAYKAKWNISR